jgi:cytochrome P450
VGVILDELTGDPHRLLARLRVQAPVSWLPALGGWLVTGYAAATEVLLDPAAFTVDDPRFTTARVTGPSMLSLDGAEHARHRAPFAHGLRPAETTRRLGDFTRTEASRLVDAIKPAGAAELRQAFAGPLAAAVMAEALGLAAVGIAPAVVLAWYREIVTAVAELTPSATAGQTASVASFGELAAGLRAAIASGRAPLLSQAARDGTLTDDEVVSNAAVALFGGIETTEGMICNAVLCLGSQPNALQIVAEDLDLVPGAVEESLRVEPAAAVVDRYATREVQLAGVTIARRDLVRVSITAANRDPAAFADPDRFDLWRPDAARHLAFARGPHFCIGAHLARLEAVTAVTTLVSRLPGLRLDPEHPAQVRGLVFRKPAALRVLWDSGSAGCGPRDGRPPTGRR